MLNIEITAVKGPDRKPDHLRVNAVAGKDILARGKVNLKGTPQAVLARVIRTELPRTVAALTLGLAGDLAAEFTPVPAPAKPKPKPKPKPKAKSAGAEDAAAG